MKLGNLLAAPVYAALLLVFVVLRVFAAYVALVHHLLRQLVRKVKRSAPSLDLDLARAAGDAVAGPGRAVKASTGAPATAGFATQFRESSSGR